MMNRILITGASRGLGLCLAVELNERGHEVVATARQLTDLVDLETAKKVRLDVTDPASVVEAAEASGAVDVVVNNAGITLHSPVEAKEQNVEIVYPLTDEP